MVNRFFFNNLIIKLLKTVYLSILFIWQAAAEAEAATMSIAKLAVPDAPTVDEANKIVRGKWLKAIENHLKQYSGNSEINDILDIGCSIGVSTRYLAEMFPSANVTVSA